MIVKTLALVGSAAIVGAFALIVAGVAWLDGIGFNWRTP